MRLLDRFFKKSAPTLEEQLRDLQECGVRLLSGATPEALLEEWSREDYDKDPYMTVVVALGGDLAERSRNLWHFDTECIEGDGSYVRIAERFRSLADGDLPLTNVQDQVEVLDGAPWLAFDLDGEHHRWKCEIQDDWVDPRILSRFAHLLKARNTGRRFTYLDTGGQDCIIGCFTPAELSRLRKTTRLDWKWLT